MSRWRHSGEKAHHGENESVSGHRADAIPLFVLGFELSGIKVSIVDSFRESYSARFYACQAGRPCRYFIGVKA
jgi:hypothetical protein